MRTTIELPDAVYREAKRLAVERGETLRVLITRAVDRELGVMRESVRVRRDALPALVVEPGAAVLGMSAEELAALDAEADVEEAIGRAD